MRSLSSSATLNRWPPLSGCSSPQRYESSSPICAGSGARPGLRVKPVQGHVGVFELNWADDGRATFMYRPEIRPGETHIVWRRIGSHEILRRP